MQKKNIKPTSISRAETVSEGLITFVDLFFDDFRNQICYIYKVLYFPILTFASSPRGVRSILTLLVADHCDNER